MGSVTCRVERSTCEVFKFQETPARILLDDCAAESSVYGRYCAEMTSSLLEVVTCWIDTLESRSVTWVRSKLWFVLAWVVAVVTPLSVIASVDDWLVR